MQLKILDSVVEGDEHRRGGATCYLCKASLMAYIQSLPIGFRDFYIQRDIVNNAFLDKLLDSIVQRAHIPNIVLVANNDISPSGSIIDIGSDYSILDGLQRTHRLKEILDVYNYIVEFIHDDQSLSAASISRRYSKDLIKNKYSNKTFQKVLNLHREKVNISKLFEENIIWLEVWSNLSENQKIQKMLILNAGHKAVNIKHQIELLFWANFALFERELGTGNVVREKDKTSITYSKTRRAGEFHFSHLVSAFVSLKEGRAINTNADFSANLTFNDGEEGDVDLTNVSEDHLKAYTGVLRQLDASLTDDVGIRWLGREVVLVGLFAALGAYSRESNDSIVDVLNGFSSSIPVFTRILNLENYEWEKDKLEHSKINVGNVNRRAVYMAVLAFLRDKKDDPISWDKHFRVDDK